MRLQAIRRLIGTVRHLKVSQLAWRVRSRLSPNRPSVPSPLPQRNDAALQWTAPIVKPTSYVGHRDFIFLNHMASLAEGDWSAANQSALWRYNLHYFDCCGSAVDPAAIHPLIDDWIVHNPPGTAVAWDSYPISLRLVNWIKFALGGARLSEPQQRSLCHQAEWLSQNLERDILANHLFANAKALYFAGSIFQSGRAGHWRDLGRTLLSEQIDEQFLDDGGHYERSPMYHAILLEDLLDIANLASAVADEAMAGKAAAAAASALGWMEWMMHPDGELSFFNDAAMGVAASRRDILDYARRLGIDVTPKPASGWLEPSGYGRLENEANVVLCDAAPIEPAYQPGHAHADTLSFEWSHLAQRVVVNSGTSGYNECERRHHERSTAAHSTLELAGQDSSHVWASFRVARRARPVRHASSDVGALEASHDGYRFLAGRPVHQRRWALTDQQLEIVDTVFDKAGHAGIIRYHLHPDITAERHEDEVRLLLPGGPQVTVSADFDCRIVVGKYAPQFGKLVDNQCLEIIWPAHAGSICRTLFRWSAA